MTLAGVLILALVLRLWNVRESLWVDELHTAWCAFGALEEVADRASLGNQSPVYFWLQWLLVRVLGPSELSLRLPSVLAGTAVPAAAFFFARRWASAGVGLVAAAMLAVDPLAVFYATEARPYALVQLLAAVHLWLALRLIEQPTPWLRRAWIASAAVLFHLHYTAALVLAAEVVLFAVEIATEQKRRSWTWLLLDFALVILLCLPALAHVGDIFSRRSNWDFVRRSAWDRIFEWWPAGLGVFFWTAAVATSRRPMERFAVFAGVISWFLVPPTIAWLTTETDQARLFFPRYLIAVQPAAALAAAWCIGFAPWRWAQWFVAVLLVSATVWNSGIADRVLSSGVVIEPRGEAWHAAIEWLNEERQTHPLPVLVASGLIEIKDLAIQRDARLEEYCLYPVNSLYPLEAHKDELAILVADQSGRLHQNVEMLAVHRGGAWLIVRGSEKVAAQTALATAAQLQALSPDSNVRWRASVQARFPGVQIALLEATQP